MQLMYCTAMCVHATASRRRDRAAAAADYNSQSVYTSEPLYTVIRQPHALYGGAVRCLEAI